MKHENLKPEMKKILDELEGKGWSRDAIEEKLNYSENYIDQQLSKGSNKRFLKAITDLNNTLLEKATSTVHEPPAQYSYSEKAITNLTETNRMMMETNKKMVDTFIDKMALLDSIKSNLDKMPLAMIDLTKGAVEKQAEAAQLILNEFEVLKNLIKDGLTVQNKKPLPNQKR
jgi:hypothetical protein